MKRCDFCGKPAVAVALRKGNPLEGKKEFIPVCAAHLGDLDTGTYSPYKDDILLGILRLQERQAEALEAIAKALTKEGS